MLDKNWSLAARWLAASDGRMMTTNSYSVQEYGGGRSMPVSAQSSNEAVRNDGRRKTPTVDLYALRGTEYLSLRQVLFWAFIGIYTVYPTSPFLVCNGRFLLPGTE